MSVDACKNFALSFVDIAPSPAGSGTTLTLIAGGAALMPTAPFNATCWPPGVPPLATNAEIVRVSSIEGSTVTLSARAQEGTAAREIEAGYQFAAMLTARTVESLEEAISDAQAAAEAASDPKGTAATAQTAAESASIPVSQKGANSGVMGLTSGGIGAQPPAPHAGTHAEGGTDPLTTADLPLTVVTGRTRIDLCRAPYNCVAGTDVTKALQEAIEALIPLGGGTIYTSKPGIYPIEGAVKTGTAAGYSYAGQVLFPAVAENKPQITIKIEGTLAPARIFELAAGGEPVQSFGTVFRSNATSGNVFDVIPAWEVTAGRSWSNLTVTFEDLNIQAPRNPECGALNLESVPGVVLNNVGLGVNAKASEAVLPTHTTSTALKLPKKGNGALVRCTNVEIFGYYTGLTHSEHADLDNVSINRCAVALNPKERAHASYYRQVLVQECATILKSTEANGAGCLIYGSIDFECATTGEFALVNVISDEHNSLIGKLDIYCDTAINAGWPIKTGAGSLEIALSNIAQGAVNTFQSTPFDEFARVLYGTTLGPGTCDKTSHSWWVKAGAVEVLAKEAKSKESAAESMMLTNYYLRQTAGSRTINSTIKTGNAGYNIELVLNRTFKSPENYIAVKVNGGKVTILRPSTLAIGAESSAAVVTEKTEYTLTATISNPIVGKYVVTAYINGVEVVKYELVAEDITNLAENAGETRKRDGLRWVNDTTSVCKSFQVVPNIA